MAYLFDHRLSIDHFSEDRIPLGPLGAVFGKHEEFEAIRDGDQTGDETTDLIRQFLRGDSQGPITQRRLSTGYEEDLLEAAEG